MDLFDEINKLFLSLSDYLTFNKILIMFFLLFLVTSIFVVIATTKSYEAKLIKSIDKFNNYFNASPQITEDNLFHFNNMMKASYVPKQLRKQWQQFVLYRDKTASEYMSFENCVSSPLKNSGYKRAIKVLNILSYLLIALSLLLNVYCMYEDVTDITWFWQQVLITPVLILILNFLLTIFLESRYNAIVSDIYSNFQYFETNMDKATTTIPEYVDYEVLFDQNEIKRGIPTLYAYLQRRAEEEKKELDRARLKNIEHEKFNFDEAGIESSLVLERAMQEAENYIAERKKYLQDVEQINSEITQEELNFREATKEYQRQMQVSKESFANFKEQLENVSSTIEANYLKKQQQQELDRQRNLERDYDSSNENHKRIMENFQNELTALENEIKQSRTTLEKGMMSEFSTYSNKVYDAAKKLVDERNEQQKQKLKAEIKALEERLAAKDQELNNIYAQNEQLNTKIINSGENVNLNQLSKVVNQRGKIAIEEDKNSVAENVEKPVVEQTKETPTVNAEFSFNYLDEDQPEEADTKPNDNQTPTTSFNFNYLDEQEDEQEEKDEQPTTSKVVTGDNSSFTFNYLDEPEEDDKVVEPKLNNADNEEGLFKFNFADDISDEDEQDDDESTDNLLEEETQKPLPVRVKSPGRPRKQQTEQKPVRGRGRPRKTETILTNEPKRSPGRPKKTETSVKPSSTTKRGRPKKEVTQVVETVSRGRGRPKKVTSHEEIAKNLQAQDNRIDELEQYLREIEAQIAEENAKIEKSKKELETNSNIRRRPRK